MLKKVDPLGGIAVTICELPGRAHGYTWTSDDVIVFGALNSGLLQVSGAAANHDHTWTFRTASEA